MRGRPWRTSGHCEKACSCRADRPSHAAWKQRKQSVRMKEGAWVLACEAKEEAPMSSSQQT